MWHRRLCLVFGAVASVLVVLGLFPSRSAEPPSHDQTPTSSQQAKTKIVLLGTAHFASVAPDILSKKRQQELDAVAEQIADWAPDRFFVECSLDDQPALDSAYQAYRAGTYDLTTPPEQVGRGEIYQLGFRTAARTPELDGVQCADAETYVPYDRAQSVAREHASGVLADYRQYSDTSYNSASLLADRTIHDFLLALNDDQRLWENYKSYLYYYARMGTFKKSGAKIRRESDLDGSTFAAPFELAERHMNELREAIETVGGKLVDEPTSNTDYVLLMDREAVTTESGPGTGPDTMHVQEISNLIERTSTTWIGFPDHHIGADVLAQRYKRDARIYANVWHAIREDEDRVILMIGQAHVWNLRKLFRDNPDFEVVPVQDLL